MSGKDEINLEGLRNEQDKSTYKNKVSDRLKEVQNNSTIRFRKNGKTY